MEIRITDDFSLKKIADSGQCFRVREFYPEKSMLSGKEMLLETEAAASGIFRFIFRDHVLYIREKRPQIYEVNCTEEEWKQVWFSYFDLGTNYAEISRAIPEPDAYLQTAAKSAKGVRILRQDPWEMLITFIISQRKSIPAIKGNVEMIAALFGRKIQTDYEELYLFPTPEQIFCKNQKNPELLAQCRLGYRLPYVRDAIEKVALGELKPGELLLLPDAALFDTLKSVKGVGDKVANCVCLFGYHRTALAPVDVWIKRAIDEHYGGKNPFPAFGDNAGIMQQFMFFYAQEKKKEL